MCGIICEIRNSGCNSIIDTQILQRIKNRGPDCYHTSEISDSKLELFFCGAVLWMQGTIPVKQPLENSNGILLFNGDIFDESWNSGLNDTEIIMDKLSNAVDYSEEHIIMQLKLLKGPFSLIYYDKLGNNLYFTRDRIGRCSLLVCKKNNSLVIGSVMGRNYNCTEIPAGNIQKLNLNTFEITLYSWQNEKWERQCALEDWLDEIQGQQNLPDDKFTFDFDSNLDLNDEEGIIQTIESEVRKNYDKITLMSNLNNIESINNVILRITDLLEKSIKIRLKTQPNKCKNCIKCEISKCNHCTVGILCSGGLDCTILALLADKFIDKDQPIDLINVAFGINENSSYDVPDRITGRQSYEELKRVCQSRKWIFKEVNVPKDVLEDKQKSTIADLVFPRNTILDESLGSALWFAASGYGCTSSCRVLLLGSGADELFGGYLRHRKAFQRQGWLGLAKELQLDWNRISFRNLSRDNRVICDHGRQPRMPYLDEDFVNYILSLKPWLRCFPNEALDCGVGDKLMLRLVALSLGLTNVVTYPKRALQFGSRIANKKQKGGDLSKNFLECK
ncbi:PREDICTED: asparagine synthetase domain-containing protein CG17486 isoform X1 [Papilio xuthus]|uniref:Asparagine synthetase domain-containing protein CG17486 isoform X1 n=2 Tax=Papilio xuthus TaxID=66420 RepID=A0AAJ7E9Q3_PAPXU|nr:PREDICTED: asparagine synthetase domain-containing protein CG17486 isoform X1 [Papilio xuthus]XP_013168399.1 PREDICTED: asparagine synthetase domain-containing protein CG17486 isoform X1 [Papilio xuthus]XP_013168400.1 PREDICTED: asparagine synthetase domain-containing protein CG17486 isoform X1 [Papilio xuthus]